MKRRILVLAAMSAIAAIAGLAAFSGRAQEASGAVAHEAQEGPTWEQAAPPPGAIVHAPPMAVIKAHPGEEVHQAIRIRRASGGAWLGVRLTEVNAEKAKELKLPGEYGALVEEVEPESPAAKAGLEKNDVIVEFAGERVRSAAQLHRLVRETPPGRAAALSVIRGGQTRTLTATLAEPAARNFEFAIPPGGAMAMPRPPVPPAAPMAPRMPMPDRDFVFLFHRGARLGISADDLTPQLAEFFGVKQGKGVLVREVTVGSAAEKAGLKAGDVIVALDEQEVSSVRDLRRALAKDADEKRTAKLTIVRNRAEQTLAVELEAARPPSPRHTAGFEGFDIDADVDVNFDEEQIRHLTEQAREQAELAVEQAREIEINRDLLEKEMERVQEEVERLTREQIQLEVEPVVADGGQVI
jgi:membrane-associated protease RseP (regulator of RpoE activity)